MVRYFFITYYFGSTIESYYSSLLSNQPDVSEEVLRMTTDEIISRTRLMENEIKVVGIY